MRAWANMRISTALHLNCKLKGAEILEIFMDKYIHSKVMTSHSHISISHFALQSIQQEVRETSIGAQYSKEKRQRVWSPSKLKYACMREVDGEKGEDVKS